MKEDTAIDLKQSYAVQEIKYPTEASIQIVEDEFKDFPTDMEVKENYTFVKSGVKKVKKLITATESHRKMLKKDALEYGRNVDKAAKSISGRFIAVNKPMIKVMTDHETKEEIARREEERIEKERQEGIETKIDEMSTIVSDNITTDSGIIKEIIGSLEEDDLSWSEEWREKVTALKSSTLIQLNELYAMKISSEEAAILAEKAEKERLQREKEEQKKRDEDQKAIQAENAKLHAENIKKEAELKEAAEKIRIEKEATARAEEQRIKAEKREAAVIEQERLNAERSKRLIAEEVEKREEERRRERIEAVQARELAAERKEQKKKDEVADKKSVALVVKKWVAGYGTTEVAAKAIVEAIRKDKFKHVKWVE